jgi:hypothetical protein
MAVSASITSGSGTALVARLRVLAALTEGLRARTGLLTPGSACGRWPLFRPVHSLGDDQVLHRQPVEHNASVDLAGLPVLVIGGLATSPHILSPLQDWLHRLGCRPLLTPSQCGIACGQRAAIAVEEALAAMLTPLASELRSLRTAVVVNSRVRSPSADLSCSEVSSRWAAR